MYETTDFRNEFYDSNVDEEEKKRNILFCQFDKKMIEYKHRNQKFEILFRIKIFKETSFILYTIDLNENFLLIIENKYLVVLQDRMILPVYSIMKL